VPPRDRSAMAQCYQEIVQNLLEEDKNDA